MPDCEILDMPFWMLKCPHCRRAFLHSKIELASIEEAHRDPFKVLPRPIFASEGERRVCPGCNKEFVFQSHHLLYRDETADFDF
jgi:hypothetical protein